MSNIIRIKRGLTGGVVPTGLTYGELAVNITDKKLFVGGFTGNTIELLGGGTGGGGNLVGGITGDYVVSVQGLTGALGLTVAGNLTLTTTGFTGADGKTFRLYSKPYAIVKGTGGALAFADPTAYFEGDGSDLGAANTLKYNYLGDLSVEMPGSLKIGTQDSPGNSSYLMFPDGSTQGSAATCCPIPLATTGSTGVASFDDTYFQLGATAHVSIKTGIKAGNLIILGTSNIFGVGSTGALPALDGSLLLEVNAKYLDGKTRTQITDGGLF